MTAPDLAASPHPEFVQERLWGPLSLAAFRGCLVSPEAFVRSQEAQIADGEGGDGGDGGCARPCWRGRQKTTCLLAGCLVLNGQKVFP